MADIKCKNRFQCGHKKSQIRKDYSRTSNIYSHEESSTSNTLFRNVKFNLIKTFFIVFEISANTKSLSSSCIAVRFSVTENTSRLFHTKKLEKL